MTSELKPCPFCGSAPELTEPFFHRKQYRYKCTGEDCYAMSGLFDEKFQAKTHWNTRAVPNMPVLERYDLVYPEPDYAIMEQTLNGEYVSYDQAAAMLAAKDAEIDKLKSLFHNDGTPRFNEAMRRAEAAEAKLAQIKAQEPFAWLCERLDFSCSGMFSKVVRNPESIAQLKDMGATITPLYASPSPPAILTAEIERLREALNDISELTRATLMVDTAGSAVNRCNLAIDIARAALNQSDTKI